MRDVRSFIQGVASLALTALLVAGVPVFLIVRFGWPFDDVINVLTDQLASDSTVVSTLLTAVLIIIAWAAWIQVTWAIAVEAVALIQGRSAKRIPILPGFQQGAAQLVASCALVVSSFTPAIPTVGTPIKPLEPAHRVTLQVITDIPDDVDTGSDARATSTPDSLYTVARGDTFWAIAEQLLGDGLRWQEIRDLNVNHTMDDGTIITTATESPKPGWVLTLPGDAVLPTTATAQAAQTHQIEVGGVVETYEVASGDSFWRIAEETLKKAWERQPSSQEIADYWHDVIEANTDRLLPPYDPNLIYPSQVVELPVAPPDPTVAVAPADTSAGADRETVGQTNVAEPDRGAETSPPDQTPNPPGEAELPQLHGLGDTQPPADQPDFHVPALTDNDGAETPLDIEDGPEPTEAAAPPVTQDQPSYTVPPTTAGPNSTQATNQAQSGPDVGTDAPDDETDQEGKALLPVGATVAGLGILGASLIALLNRLRRRQLRQRQPGTTPTPPPSTAMRVESTLRAAAAPDATQLIDLALRAMAHDINSTGRRPPELVGVHLEPDKLRILLWAPQHEAPSGWDVDDDGRSWTLPTTVDATQLHFFADTTPAPYPALVTVGHGDDNQLLLDLTFPGAIQVTGEPTEVVATCYTIATELAASPFADTLQVVCVGFGHNLANLERITVVDELGDIADLIDERRAATESQDPWRGVAPADSMWRFDGQDRPDTLIVLDPHATPPEGATQLLTVALGGDAVAAVVGYPTGGRWRFHIADGSIRIDPLGYTLNRRNLTRNEQEAVADLVTAAKDLNGVPEADQDPAPGTPVALTADHGTADDIDAGIAPASEPIDLVEAPESPADIKAGTSEVAEFQTWVTEEVLGGEPEPGHRRAVPPDEAADSIAPAVDHAATVDHAEEAPPSVLVLGTLRVTGLVERFEQAKCAELVTYLALHRHGTEPDTLMEAMWPEQPPSLQRLRVVVARARAALGKDTDTDPYLPVIAKGELYRVSPKVSCDLERFTQHVQSATTNPADAQRHLRAALELVEGPPFSGAFNGYSWAHTKGIITHAIVTVDNAAHRLAKLALDANDPTLAMWAARQGLTATGVCEECYRNLMRCAIAENNKTALDATIDELTAVMDADDGPDAATYLEDETMELYEQHRRRRHTTAD